MTAPHRVCGIGLLVAALATGPMRADAAARVDSPTELVLQGEEKAANGEHAEAARFYLEAYKGMPADERAQMGDLIVESALESVKKAYNKSPDPDLLDLGTELIEAYGSDMSGPEPAFIDEARRWIEERRERDGDGGPGENPFEDPDLPDDPVGDDDGIGADDGGSQTDEIAGPILVGVGGAMGVSGIIMLALGARLPNKVEDTRRDFYAGDEYTTFVNDPDTTQAQIDQFDADYDAYIDRENKRGKNLMIGGGILLGIGVGAAVYGVVRMVQHRKKKKNGSSAAQVLPSAGGLFVRF